MAGYSKYGKSALETFDAAVVGGTKPVIGECCRVNLKASVHEKIMKES
jgi:hypothetical protein